MPSGLQLVSTTATMGMPSFLASAMAICSLLVSITNSRSGRPPISLMPPSDLLSVSRSRVSCSSSFLVRPLASPASSLLELLQAADRLGDGLPVGERAAEPAVIDEILRRALGGIGDALGGLPLGADEQHAAAAGHHVADLDQRLVQQRHRLREIDDVDVVAGAEDEVRHLRVPAMALVAEVAASLEQLTHIEGGKRHGCVVLFRLNRRGTREKAGNLD